MSKKIALITGITGQDGSYLAEILLEKKYSVHGVVRRSSTTNRNRIEHLDRENIFGSLSDLTLHYGDVTESSSLHSIIGAVQPDEVYHLAAQSDVRVSFDQAEYTANVTGLGVSRILEAVRQEVPNARVYQASSSEMFGLPTEVPQTEKTQFHPRSPYGAAKVFGFWQAVNYRESYGMHISNGILFNHESPRRGENFVSRKITKTLVDVIRGRRNRLYLGNLNARRDWGYAREYAEVMWRMLQQDAPDDFVIATNESHSVREFAEMACAILGIDLVWEGSGKEEKGRDKKTNKVIIEIDPYYFRPTEVDHLCGDYSKASRELHWTPNVKFKQLVSMMVEHDLSFASSHDGGEKKIYATSVETQPGKTPLVSICLPTYNRPKEVSRTLASFAEQFTEGIELLIRDDSESDETQDVIMPYLQRYSVRVIRGKREGIDEALLSLIDEAQGEYIWLFGDDLLEDGAISYILNVLSANRDVSFLYINSREIYNKDVSALSIGSERFFQNRDEVLESIADLLAFVSATLFRRSYALTGLARARTHRGTALVNLYTVLHVLTLPGRFYYIDRPFILSEPKNPSEPLWYDSFAVFAIYFSNILHEFNASFSAHSIHRALAYNIGRILRGILVYRAKDICIGLGGNNVKVTTLFKYYWNFREFWLALPFLLMPRSVVRSCYLLYKKFSRI